MLYFSYNTQATAVVSQKTGDEQSALNRILHQTAKYVFELSTQHVTLIQEAYIIYTVNAFTEVYIKLNISFVL